MRTHPFVAYCPIGAGNLWGEHGALRYRECVGDDLNITGTRA
jgi:uncharacterized protein YbaA (DUF1428 family)